MTTSCCPGFVNMLKIHFPTIYEKNKSTTYSPMMALANKLKKEHPDHGVVFIGPCLAKKQEAMEQNTPVDYVLTFEEIAAMLVARHIWPTEVEAEVTNEASNFGRNFASGGGVHQAVMQAAKEKGEGPYTAYYANGAIECKKQLMLLKAGKFNFDILEGMCCDGGCLGGPATIVNSMTAKGRMVKENITNPIKTIQGSLDACSFEGVKMHIDHKEETENGTD